MIASVALLFYGRQMLSPAVRLLAVSALLSSAVLCDSWAKSPKLSATTSWVGNTFPGAEKWVQQDIAALWVDADGTVYANVEWDEGGREIGVYRDGDVIGKGGRTHGWGNHGGRAIAANRRYVFAGAAMTNERGGLKDPTTWPPTGSTWWGVTRRLKSDITKGAPFAGGKGGKGDTLKESFLVVAEVPDTEKGAITGIWATDTRLFVSDPSAGKIRVYDAETMEPVATWDCPNPGQLAMDRDGALWAWRGGERQGFARYSTKGEAQAVELPLPKGAVVSTFCFNEAGQLLVGDTGPAQQIHVFADLPSKPRLVKSIGEPGGIFSGTSGAYGPLRFHEISGIGCDAKGNLYVAQDGQSGGGGTVLESYSPEGKLRWNLFGLEFVDMADVDPAQDTEVFTKEEHLRMDYAKPAGREWSYSGFTLDRAKYPQDPRNHIWSAGAWTRQIGGKRVLFVNDMNGDHLQVYRFNVGSEIAIPSGFFAKKHVKTKTPDWPPNQPAKGQWIWRDANGNGAFDADEFAVSESDAAASQGWWVDAVGNVWLATEKQGIRVVLCDGLDAQGNPRWDAAKARVFAAPAEFDQIKRLRYDAENDVMFLGGTKSEDKNQHWKPMGPVIACYEGWMKGTPKLRWKAVLPYATGAKGHESCEPMGFDVAGDYVFVPYTGASKTMGFTTGHVEVYRVTDGSSVGHFEPSAEVGEIGLQDIRECLRAHRRADGEYLIFLEEDAKAKVVLYRWRP